MLSIQNDLLQLNGELRRTSQEGIDLYLKNSLNNNIKDYTDGGKLSHDEAISRYMEENFGYRTKGNDGEEIKDSSCS